MKKDFTKIAVVLDRSGSMATIRQATIDGFNEFLQGQKSVQGEANLTLAQFDDEYNIVHDSVDIQKLPNLNMDTFVPRGMTALYDAVCKTIDSIGEELRRLPESSRPEKVVFVIITDGGENASREFSYEDMTSRISHQQEKYNWEFVFIGANQNAMATALRFNIPITNAITYTASPLSTRGVFTGLSKKLTNYRDGGAVNMAYTSQDREEQEELDNK